MIWNYGLCKRIVASKNDVAAVLPFDLKSYFEKR
jgi:hypothetical protein